MDSGWVRQNGSRDKRPKNGAGARGGPGGQTGQAGDAASASPRDGESESESESALSSWGHVTPLPFVGSDEDLIEALDKGHPGAANAFYDRYAEVVDRILSRVVGPDAD